MSFPKRGKFFPPRSRYTGKGEVDGDRNFAAEIAAALHRSLGSIRSGVKTAAFWTGANEKTVKNWFSGGSRPRRIQVSGCRIAVTPVRRNFLV